MTKILSLSSANYTITLPILMLVFLITLLIGKLFILPVKTTKNCEPQAILTTMHPNEIALVFDLHGVLFNFSLSKAIYDAVSSRQKKQLIIAGLNPFLIWDLIKLVYNSGVVEKAIFDMGQKYPSLKSLVPLVLKMANEQTPIKSTVDLIKTLKKQGFKLYVFSNIGEQSGQILQTKYPEIFALFDGLLFTSAQDNYVSKPSQAAFDKFLTKFNLDKSQIIFIDDKQSNVQIANKFGINAIQFINASQCKQALKKFINTKSIQSDLNLDLDFL